MRPHPLGVLPEGNQYLVPADVVAKSAKARHDGLGNFAALSDVLVMRVLTGGDAEEFLGVDPSTLGKLATTSKAFQAFTHHEDLWKALVLHRDRGGFVWEGSSWRETFVAGAARDWGRKMEAGDDGAKNRSEKNIDSARGSAKPLPIFSDALYLRHLAQHRYICKEWLEKETIPRMDGRVGAGEDVDGQKMQEMQKHFVETFEARNEPVILTGACSDWPCVSQKLWTFGKLLESVPHAKTFSVGGYQMRLRDWRRYCDGFLRNQDDGDESPPRHETEKNESNDEEPATSRGNSGAPIDDHPLYLFDKTFAETCPTVFGNDTWHPPTVIAPRSDETTQDVTGKQSHDLFAALGENRPDYRWLIHGPARSGSSFHVDPNGTSAWNAVVSGKKRWILFKPGVPPPGVHPSEDGATVAQPVTLVEWYASFYEHAYDDEKEEEEEEESDDDDADEEENNPEANVAANPKGNPEAKNPRNPSKYRVLEGTCGVGDVLFVPSGWWHAALNLTETTAVTQNFCSTRTLPRVLRFLKNAFEKGGAVGKELVSGTSRESRGNLFENFVKALREKRPEVLGSREVRKILGDDFFGDDGKNISNDECGTTRKENGPTASPSTHPTTDGGKRKRVGNDTTESIKSNGGALAALFTHTSGNEKNQKSSSAFSFGF